MLRNESKKPESLETKARSQKARRIVHHLLSRDKGRDKHGRDRDRPRGPTGPEAGGQRKGKIRWAIGPWRV